MSDDWWSTAGGVQSALRDEIKRRDDRIEDLEAERDALVEKLEKVAGALREYLSPTAEPEDDGIPLLRATLAQITGDKTDE